jgi:Cdc6-like AAA superfamily ATPase
MLTSLRVFEDEHLPRELIHRDAELQTLTRAWKPVRHGERAGDIILSRPSGVGKTVLVRHALERLERAVAVGTAHVPCLGATTGAILRTILEDLGQDAPQNQPIDDLRWTLRDADEDPVVVVLDEADGLAGNDALEYLREIRRLSLVVVTHEPEQWLADASPMVRDRLTGAGCTHLELDGYSTEELADILERRANRGLRPDSVRREQLREIDGEVGGVAREGIQSLRAAAELAEERGHERVMDADIADCFERARHWIREQNLQSLPYHHHVLYAIIQEAGEISATALHDRYEAVAEEVYRDKRSMPIGERARRGTLRKLQKYDLINGDGNGRDRTYRVLDGAIASRVTLGESIAQ